MSRDLSTEAEATLRDVELVAAGLISRQRLVPLATRLVRLAPHGSEPWRYAHLLLAEHLVHHDPWRAALMARRVVTSPGGMTQAHGWGLLGLACSLLGHTAMAVRAYRRALSLAPTNPWYAHNLGHLYDACLDEPERALPLLAQAASALPDEPEVLSSYAHALTRCGEAQRARELMMPVMRGEPTPEQHRIYGWIVECHDEEVDRHLAEMDLAEVPTRRRLRRRRTR